MPAQFLRSPFGDEGVCWSKGVAELTHLYGVMAGLRMPALYAVDLPLQRSDMPAKSTVETGASWLLRPSRGTRRRRKTALRR